MRFFYYLSRVRASDLTDGDPAATHAPADPATQNLPAHPATQNLPAHPAGQWALQAFQSLKGQRPAEPPLLGLLGADADSAKETRDKHSDAHSSVAADLLRARESVFSHTSGPVRGSPRKALPPAFTPGKRPGPGKDKARPRLHASTPPRLHASMLPASCAFRQALVPFVAGVDRRTQVRQRRRAVPHPPAHPARVGAQASLQSVFPPPLPGARAPLRPSSFDPGAPAQANQSLPRPIFYSPWRPLDYRLIDFQARRVPAPEWTGDRLPFVRMARRLTCTAATTRVLEKLRALFVWLTHVFCWRADVQVCPPARALHT